MKRRISIFFITPLFIIFLVGCMSTNSIDAPKNLRIDNNFLSFDEVKNAKHYELTILDENHQEVDTVIITNNFDLGTLTIQSGEYFFKLRAVLQNNDDLIFSIYSDKIAYLKENVMENNILIEALGKIANKITINTIFRWTNPRNDSSFNVVLVDEWNNTIFNENLSETELQLDFMLQPQTTYTLSVEGSESKIKVQEEYYTFGERSDLLFEPEMSILTISEPFRNNMVIQRNESINVSGKTAHHIMVKVSINNNIQYTVSDETGHYELNLSPMIENNQGQTLSVEIAKNKKLEIHDVLIGDVYLVAGQSNMQWSLKDSDFLEEDVENAEQNLVRFFYQDTNTSSQQLNTVRNGKWFKVSQLDKSYTNYSAIGFMFGSILSEELKDDHVPIGIIYAAQGDTNIVNWMNKDFYDGQIQTKNINYNAMIHPLRNVKLSGVVWYQGENNSSKGISYRQLLLSFFENWRTVFNNEQLPFYLVQLPVYDGDPGNNFDFSYVREAQYLASIDSENVYLIATVDSGNPKNIHPREKRYISERIAKSVLSTIYQKDYLPQGPIYKDHVIEDHKVIVSTHFSEGLYAAGNIVGFELAGVDGKYYHATAEIEGEHIILESTNVINPQYIRYGFEKSPFLNIYNKDGFLLSPFRTDNFNLNINLLEYENLDLYKMHIDGSLMTVENDEYEGEPILYITKQNDGRTFGSLILDKFGAIGNNPSDFKLKVVGTNSNARILFRIVEGSSEIWAYTFIDDFTGVKEIQVKTSDFICVYNCNDRIMDFEGVMSVEVTIESQGQVMIGIIDVMFIETDGS